MGEPCVSIGSVTVERVKRGIRETTNHANLRESIRDYGCILYASQVQSMAAKSITIRTDPTILREDFCIGEVHGPATELGHRGCLEAVP